MSVSSTISYYREHCPGLVKAEKEGSDWMCESDLHEACSHKVPWKCEDKGCFEKWHIATQYRVVEVISGVARVTRYVDAFSDGNIEPHESWIEGEEYDPLISAEGDALWREYNEYRKTNCAHCGGTFNKKDMIEDSEATDVEELGLVHRIFYCKTCAEDLAEESLDEYDRIGMCRGDF